MAAAVTAPTQAAAVDTSMHSAAAHPRRTRAKAFSSSMKSRQNPFVESWLSSVQPKLRRLLALLGSQNVARNLALAQVWNYVPVLLDDEQLLKVDSLCLLGTAELQDFHSKCCSYGVPVHMLGAMGKVWESGVIKVVQSLDNLSRETHPCNRLQGGLERHVEEVVYIPAFDQGELSSSGVVAVLELLISSQAHDYMVVANTISCVAQLMEEVQLSLSNPSAQPPAPRPAPSAAAPATSSGGCSQTCIGQGLSTHSRQGQAVHSTAVAVAAVTSTASHPQDPSTAPPCPTASGQLLEGSVEQSQLSTPNSSPTLATPFASHSPPPPPPPHPASTTPQGQVPHGPTLPICTAGAPPCAAPIARSTSVPHPPASRPAPPQVRSASLTTHPPPWPGAAWCKAQASGCQSSVAGRCGGGMEGGECGGPCPARPL